MEKRIFGRTALEVSVLGIGGAPVGFLSTEQRQVSRILNYLLDQGVNLIDTAAMYPGSEEAIGKAVSDRREEYVLVSKCGQAFEDLEGEAWSPRVIRQTVDRALRRLQTDYLDVMLLHSCDMETLKRGDALGELVAARDAGKVRFVGYSGDNEAAAYAADLRDVAVVETSINLCDQANIEAVLPVARKHHVGVIAKRPLANAAWKQLSEQPGMYADYAQTYTERLAQMRIKPEDHGFEAADWPELALRFTISHPIVSTAIVGSTNPEHVERNIASVNKGFLPEDTVIQLRKIFDTTQEELGQRWEGQT